MASTDERQYHGWAVIPKLNLHSAEVQEIAPISVPEHIFNNGRWVESPASFKAGFPIKVLLTKFGPGYNNVAANLLRVCDIDDPFCGATLALAAAAAENDKEKHQRPETTKFLDGTDDVRGTYVFFRVDGQNLSYPHFDALQAFIIRAYLGHFKGTRLAGLTPETQKHAKDELGQKLTPSAFAAYFEEWKRQSIADEREGWSWDVKCPVQASYDTCGYCGAREKADGEQLGACFRCKKRFWCSEFCAKRDGARHSFTCRELFSDEPLNRPPRWETPKRPEDGGILVGGSARINPSVVKMNGASVVTISPSIYLAMLFSIISFLVWFWLHEIPLQDGSGWET